LTTSIKRCSPQSRLTGIFFWYINIDFISKSSLDHTRKGMDKFARTCTLQTMRVISHHKTLK
jgi:hypothetical protein